MSYWRARKHVELLKKAQGKVSVDIPDELIQLEQQLLAQKASITRLIAQKAEESKIGEATVALAAIESRMRTIIAKLGIS